MSSDEGNGGFGGGERNIDEGGGSCNGRVTTKLKLAAVE